MLFFYLQHSPQKMDYSRSNYTSTQTERERERKRRAPPPPPTLSLSVFVYLYNVVGGGGGGEREEFPDQVNKMHRTGICVPVTPNPPSHRTGGKQADQSKCTSLGNVTFVADMGYGYSALSFFFFFFKVLSHK